MTTNSIKKLLILLTTIALTASTCSDGCLRCGKDNTCLFCDFTSQYIMKEGSCIKNSNPDCKIMNQNGNCMMCKDNHFLDISVGTCVAVPADQEIKNCLSYGSLTICKKCAGNFYLENGACYDVDLKVPGCKVHGKDVCLECDKGRILHPKKERCIEDPKKDNCLNYGYLKCNQCREGFVLNPNFFLHNLFGNFNLDKTKIRGFLNNVLNEKIDNTGISPCQPLEVKNCLIYDDSFRCKKCSQFYYTDTEKNCQPFPLPQIPNCNYYLNYNECTKCNPGFLLASRTECKAVEKIDNCLVYDTEVSANVCLECDEGFYVSGNICRERNQEVENCLTYSKNNDNCSECNSGFGISSSKLACLGFTPNCKTHNFNNTNGETFPCVSCNDTFYFTGSECLSGSIPNCDVYASESICTKCAQGNYFFDNLCNLHVDIERCNTYSERTQDVCVNCDNDSVLIVQKKGCKKIESDISYCREYSDPLTCSACEEKSSLVNNECVPIPSEEFCLEKVSTNCIKCENGYLLEGGACKAAFEFELQDCYEKSPGIANSFTCEKCEVDRIPWKHEENEFHCVLDSERLGVNNSITNCILYKKDNNNDICLKCKEGYVVTENYLSCIALNTCPVLFLNILFNKTSGPFTSDTYHDRINFCLTLNIPLSTENCKIFGNKFSGNMSMEMPGCLKCQDSFIPVTHDDSITDVSSINPNKLDDFDNFEFKMFYPSSLSRCIALEANTFQGGVLTSIQNCEFYHFKSNVFYCVKCKFGYSGILNLDLPEKYLTCEKIIEDCDIDTYYGNIFDNVRIGTEFVNCHKCLSKNKIPIIFVDQNDFMTKPFEFTYENKTSSNTANDNGQWLQCLEPIAKSFKMDKSLFTQRFPEHCAFGYFSINQNKDYRHFTGHSTSLVCGACKPGYRKILLEKNTGNQMVFKCEKIENCENTHKVKWFNSCSKCKQGYAWKFVDTLQIDICMKVQDINCLFARENDLNKDYSFVRSKECIECKKGYSMNYDGICSKLNSPFCKEGEYNTQSIHVYNPSNPTYNLTTKMKGCNQCEEGYVGYRLNEVRNSCIRDSYIHSRKMSITHYVRNCRNFKLIGNNPSCVVCNIGFIISKNGKNCVRQDTNPNCKYINDTGNECAECYERFVLIEGFCEKPLITNCLIYQNGMNYQKCQTCENTFKLVNNNCVSGKVKNCKRYDNLGLCTECFPQYQLIGIINQDQYCLPIPKYFSCLTFRNNNLSLGQLFCETCFTGYAPTIVEEDLVKSACLSLDTVLNCEEYNNTGNFNNSNLQCIRCNESFYLKDNTCIQRNKTIPNCNSFSITNNYCISCDEGFYLTNTKECQEFPSGIYGCVNYKDSATCVNCDEYMYLNNNVCMDIEVQDRIMNCKYFKTPDQCLKCEMNYFLNDIGKCELAKAQNCETYKSITECASCPENFGFYEDLNTNYLNCLYKSTPNCQMSEDHFPFGCLKCNKFFYSDEGKCLSNEKFIPYCDEYETRDTCQKCEREYILSYDHKKCLSPDQFGLQPFESCENNEQTKYPLCDGCKFGYQFYKGQCMICNTHTIESGCLYCTGIDIEVCLVCKPGYYQSEDGSCVFNGELAGFKRNKQMQNSFEKIGGMFLILLLINFA